MKTIKWTGRSGDMRWADASNWSGHAVPGTGQNVVFNDGRSWTIDLAGVDPQLGALTVLRDSVTILNNSISLNAAPKHGVATDLVVGQGGSLIFGINSLLRATNTLQVGAVVGGTLTAGHLTINGGGSASEVQVLDGVFSVTGQGAGWSPANSTSTIQVGGPAGTAFVVSQGGTVSAGQANSSYVYVGNGSGDGQVLVTDAGSRLSQTIITLGDGYSGMLTVQNGGEVDVVNLNVGQQNGDGFANVTAGGILAAQSEIIVGSTQPPVASALTITNFGSVYAGSVGLILEEGRLTIDPTGVLFGPIYSAGGKLDAVAGPNEPGIVTLNNAIQLANLTTDQFGGVSNAYSEGGAVLDLTGRITSSASGAVLQIGAGTVELANAANGQTLTSLAGGTLVLAASGAAGVGTLTFLNAYNQMAGTADLVVQSGVALNNTLAGIASTDTIDLQGFAFGMGVTDAVHGNVLTLDNGSITTTLNFASTYSAAQFTFSRDDHGGTLIAFHA